jgi:hypothetical protein
METNTTTNKSTMIINEIKRSIIKALEKDYGLFTEVAGDDRKEWYNNMVIENDTMNITLLDGTSYELTIKSK